MQNCNCSQNNTNNIIVFPLFTLFACVCESYTFFHALPALRCYGGDRLWYFEIQITPLKKNRICTHLFIHSSVTSVLFWHLKVKNQTNKVHTACCFIERFYNIFIWMDAPFFSDSRFGHHFSFFNHSWSLRFLFQCILCEHRNSTKSTARILNM